MNKCIFSGNLTKDPELRTTTSGKSVISFTIATNERYKDANGQLVNEASFHDCEAWGTGAETIEKYLHKGDGIIVEGRHKTDVWEDKTTKQKRSRSKFRVDHFYFPPGSKKSVGTPEKDAGSGNEVDDDKSVPF